MLVIQFQEVAEHFASLTDLIPREALQKVDLLIRNTVCFGLTEGGNRRLVEVPKDFRAPYAEW